MTIDPDEAERVKATIEKLRSEIEEYAREHILGGPPAEDTLEAWQTITRELFERGLPGYTAQLVNPRIEGASLVADGLMLEKLDAPV